MQVLWGLGGMLVVLLLAFAMSTNRRAINPRTVLGALAVQILFAVLVLRWDVGKQALSAVSGAVQKVLDSSKEGIEFMVGPILQARVMEKAGGSPSLVSAAIQSAFNIANSIGAYLGGLAIAGGFGLVSPNVVGAMLALVGLTLTVSSAVFDRRRAARVASVDSPDGVDDVDNPRVDDAVQDDSPLEQPGIEPRLESRPEPVAA